MLKDVECLGHSTIKIYKEGKTIYFDPYDIKEEKNDADIIFITHNHYDHYSEDDIKKIKNKDTIIVVTEDLYESAVKLGFLDINVIKVKPNEKYKIYNINFNTIPAYNTNKKFHPKENKWVGYIIELDKVRYYIAGDTDITEENKKVKCDVAFVPVGGTYTMDFKEAAHLINEMKPKVAIPIHYGKIVGTKQDAEDFKKLLRPTIRCNILIKE
jgi:L-ascorbate metabolism protein UlaG (beta-lactamase superfamily)